jgi:hypothetical protein
MTAVEINIKKVNDKVQLLLKKYLQLQKDNDRQSLLIAELQASSKKEAEQKKQLQDQVHILKAAAGKMNDADKKAFEKNINQYIKEINKCIGFLTD